MFETVYKQVNVKHLIVHILIASQPTVALNVMLRQRQTFISLLYLLTCTKKRYTIHTDTDKESCILSNTDLSKLMQICLC